MKLLNPDYDGLSVGGSLYYNGKNGSCYTDISAVTTCNFTNGGLVNDI